MINLFMNSKKALTQYSFIFTVFFSFRWVMLIEN